MTRTTKNHLAIMLWVTALLNIGCVGPVTAQRSTLRTFTPGEYVELDFILRPKKSVAWLEARLASKGYSRCTGCQNEGHYSIEGRKLSTTDPAVARYANRIRAFFSFRDSTNSPYYHLVLQDPEGRKADCVTEFPRAVVQSFSRMDFDRQVFPVDDLGTSASKYCMKSASSKQPYKGLSRDTFRTTYFGKHGELLIATYPELATDPQFILTAMDHGFYTFQGCVTGYLQLR